jgi:uncharacterized protein YndB with AHSA1/START domain
MGVIFKILLVLVGLAAVVFAIGLGLPRNHRATSRILLEKPPEAVWAIVSDPTSLLGTWSELKSARRTSDGRGREVWEQNAGGFDMRLIVERSEAPSRLVTRIDAAEDAAFGGTWTYAITPSGANTVLTITEDGYVGNPFFRVMMAIMGKYRTIDGYLKAVAEKLEDVARPDHVRE